MKRYEAISEEGAYDPVGTIRVDETLGATGIYVKVGPDQWHPIYVDPASGESFSPGVTMSDRVACGFHVVYSPKPAA